MKILNSTLAKTAFIFVNVLISLNSFASDLLSSQGIEILSSMLSEHSILADEIRVNGNLVSEKGLSIKTSENLVQISKSLISAIEVCKSPCFLEISGKQFVIEKPMLGQGERGIVYRLLGEKSGKVIKFSRSNLKSLVTLKQEKKSQDFWEASAKGFLNVVHQFETDSLGFFSIMEEVSGESLTTALFRNGILQVDPFNSKVHIVPELVVANSHDVNKIWAAIDVAIQAIKLNPHMKTSLSPNNFFVSYKSESSRVSKITLIDLGVDELGDSRYLELNSANEYLKLAAEKIEGYLSKPNFLNRDLLRIQEENRIKNGIAPAYDVNSNASLLMDLAKQLHMSFPVVGSKLNSEALLKMLWQPLNGQPLPQVKIDNVSIFPPNSVFDLTRYSSEIFEYIRQNQERSEFLLRFGSDEQLIESNPLGMGDRGVVFAIKGKEQVIKLPKPNLISILTLLNEAKAYQFWNDQAKKSNGNFEVPKRISNNPLGLYSIMVRDRGEPLTNAFVRLGYLSFDPETKLATKKLPDQISSSAFPHFEQNQIIVENSILSMKQVIEKHPEMALSISPNNLHVHYRDRQKTQIEKIVLIDVGLTPNGHAKVKQISDFDSYLESSRERLEKYLRKGYIDKELLTLNSRVPLQKSCRQVLMNY